MLIFNTNKEDIVEQSGGISKNGKKVNLYWRKAKIVLKLIISAIFGDPIGIIAAICFEPLFSSWFFIFTMTQVDLFCVEEDEKFM